jgi:hypothetical protein
MQDKYHGSRYGDDSGVESPSSMYHVVRGKIFAAPRNLGAKGGMRLMRGRRNRVVLVCNVVQSKLQSLI